MIHKKNSIFLVIGIVFLLLCLYLIVPPVWQLTRKEVLIKRFYKNNPNPVIVKVGPSTSDWISINNVSKNLINAIVVAEDSRFYTHYGIDIVEIINSLKLNIKAKRYVRGASTITQQVVRVIFLSSKKTLWRKIREVLGALILELLLSKQEILEWYINIVKFGNNIYGIKKAAYYYFNVHPEFLTIEQSIHLALILPSPNVWSIGLKRKNLTDFGHKRFTVIAYNMKRSGYITKDQFLNVLARGNFGQPVKGYYDIYKADILDNNYNKHIFSTKEQETIYQDEDKHYTLLDENDSEGNIKEDIKNNGQED